MPFQNGDAFGFKRRAFANPRRQLVFHGVDGPLNHGLVRLRHLASKKLNWRLLATVRDHGTWPHCLERLHAVFFKGDARELQASLIKSLLVLPHRLGVVNCINVDELISQLSVARPRHPLQQRLHLSLQPTPLSRQFACQVARDQHVVLKFLQQLACPVGQGVSLLRGQIQSTVHQLAQHHHDAKDGRGQHQRGALTHQPASPHGQHKTGHKHRQHHPGDEIQHVSRVQTPLAHGVKMGLHAKLDNDVFPRTQHREIRHGTWPHVAHHGRHDGQKERHQRLGGH